MQPEALRVAQFFRSTFEERDVHLTRHTLSHPGSPVLEVGHLVVPHRDGGELTVAFSLQLEDSLPPPGHVHHLFSVVDGFVPEVLELLAGLHHYHARVAPLWQGSTVPLAPGSRLVEAPPGGPGFTHALIDEPFLFAPMASCLEKGPFEVIEGSCLLAVCVARADEVVAFRRDGMTGFVDARIARGLTPLDVARTAKSSER